MNRLFSSALPLLVTLAGTAPAFALEPIAVLRPSDMPPGFTPYGNGFAQAVSISGDYVAVGAYLDPWENGDVTGAVYVFERIGPRWVERAKLTSPDTEWPDMLGFSVAMEGDVIVAGAPSVREIIPCQSHRPGAVYVFRRNDNGTPDSSDDTWPQEARLTLPMPGGRELGLSVALSGDRIVATNICDRSAQVFRYVQGAWTHEATLHELTPEDWEQFGTSVDIEGQQIVVGASYHDESRGAAYVFTYSDDGWLPETSLVGANEGDVLGASVALMAERVVAGALGIGDAWPIANSGGAVVFFLRKVPGAWTSEATFAPSPAVDSSKFGAGLACESGLCLLSNWQGSPYLFRLDEDAWRQEEKLLGVPGWSSVSLDGNYGIAGNYIYVLKNRQSLRDFSRFQTCMHSEQLETVRCDDLEVTNDGALDLLDFAEFMALFGGP